MRILFLSGRELGYQRNEVIVRALGRLGAVKVISPRVQSRSLAWSSTIVALRAMPSLLLNEYDLVIVGFFGHLLMFPVKILTSKAILFDAFISVYDTLAGDRTVISQGSWMGRLAHWLDRTACRLATHVLLDTRQHAEYFKSTFEVPTPKLSALPVGCNEDLFYPQPSPTGHSSTNVLYYSTYQPLHGVETVVRAAHLLSGEADLSIKLIGRGQEYSKVHRLARELNVTNLIFADPVPLDRLPGEIASADICLGGHFGLSEKAGRVVPGKIYQLLAMERAVIAAQTSANCDLLAHKETAYLVPPADPQALVEAIMELHKDGELRRNLARAGRRLFLERCSEAIITRKLAETLERIG